MTNPDKYPLDCDPPKSYTLNACSKMQQWLKYIQGREAGRESVKEARVYFRLSDEGVTSGYRTADLEKIPGHQRPKPSQAASYPAGDNGLG